MKLITKFLNLGFLTNSKRSRLKNKTFSFNKTLLSFLFAILFFGQVPAAYANDFNTISGDLKDNSGNSIRYAMVCVQENQSSTTLDVQADGDGHYTIDVPAGIYSVRICDNNGANLGVYIDPITGNNNGTSFGGITPDGITNPYVVDVSGGDAVQNLLFDTVKVKFTIKDANGTPVVYNAFQQIDSSSGNTTLLEAYSDISYNTSQIAVNSSRTDSEGVTHEVTLLRGITYNSCTIDDTILNNTQVTCSTITPINDNSVVTVDLPYVVSSAPLSAPTGLTAQSPTNAPHLTWNAVAGATSYNIYANGIFIGTSTANSYTDDNPISGVNTYYVTAVNESGESGSSNTVNVTVDITAPVVTNVSQIWNAIKQRTEITITFSEPVSGLPQGWYGSGTTYTKAFYNTKLATVTFHDAVGNTGSTTVKPIGPQ